jgi:hypothetical protein
MRNRVLSEHPELAEFAQKGPAALAETPSRSAQ